MWENKEKHLDSYYYEKKSVYNCYDDVYKYFYDYEKTTESPSERRARIKAEERERKINIILGE
jgi:hypothetical protein